MGPRTIYCPECGFELEQNKKRGYWLHNRKREDTIRKRCTARWSIRLSDCCNVTQEIQFLDWEDE